MALRAFHDRHRAILMAGALSAAAYFDGESGKSARSGSRPMRCTAASTAVGAERRPAVSHGWKPGDGFLSTAGPATARRCALPPRPGIADASAPPKSYDAFDVDLPLESSTASISCYAAPAVHPPALAPLGRFPRHPGRLHARAGHRLLREQPPRHPGPARVRDPESEALRGYGENCWGITASDGPGPATLESEA